jgi:serine/threonine-protein kinase
MAYEILTGQQPFPRSTPQAVLVAHAIEQPTPLATRRPDLPPALVNMVMRLLEKRPSTSLWLFEAFRLPAVGGYSAPMLP